MTRIKNASIRNQERKHPRFPLEYPVQLMFRGDGERQELEAMSNNISQSGVLLQAPSPVPPDCEVEFVMTIQRSKTREPIRLKGAGRVVRQEQHLSGRGFGIAIECKRPIRWNLRQVRGFLV
jgi:PilZ domain